MSSKVATPRPVMSPTTMDSARSVGLLSDPGAASLTMDWMNVPLDFEQSISNLPAFRTVPVLARIDGMNVVKSYACTWLLTPSKRNLFYSVTRID